MPPRKTKSTVKRRAMSKQARRDQLIKATIKCIASHGLSGTTMADITQEAGLSLGIVNLHFKSKEKLLIETLRHVADEYKDGLDRIFSDTSKSKVEKLIAHVDYDFSSKIINRNKLAVWFAFWGEAKSRPTYSKICAKHDTDLALSLTLLFKELIEEGDYRHADAELITTAYTALADGLWLDILITPRETSPAKAHAIAMNYLSIQFPRHLSVN